MVAPLVLAAIIGAAMGAGKTALNKETRKSPSAYIQNTIGGAASGAASGSPGGAFLSSAGSFGGGGGGQTLTGQVQKNNFMQGGDAADAGEAALGGMGMPGEPGMEEDRPVITGGVEKGGKGQLLADLLKAYVGRNRGGTLPAISYQTAPFNPTTLNLPQINAPTAMPVSDQQPYFKSRGRY